MCYISSIFLYFHWDFDNRHYFYDKGTFIGFFKSSLSARLYLEVLVTMIPRLNLKTACIDSLFCYISFFPSIALLPFGKKWLSYLSHAFSPYLNGKLINWTSAFYLNFCCMVLLRILNVLIFMNRVISVIYICQLYFMLFHMYVLHCMVLVSILTTRSYII